jgi:uncharacterized protein YdcH (DUF465 family)
MPGGRYNLNTIEGIEKKLSALNSKKENLLREAEEVDKEIVHLEKTVDGLKNAEILDVIKRSGKSMDEVRAALGL